MIKSLVLILCNIFVVRKILESFYTILLVHCIEFIFFKQCKLCMPIPYHVDNDIQLHYYATNLFLRSTLQIFNFHFMITLK